MIFTQTIKHPTKRPIMCQVLNLLSVAPHQPKTVRVMVGGPMFALGLFILLAAPTRLKAEESSTDNRFVVHEWGVVVRGRSVEGPILRAPHRLLTGLPTFVLNHQTEYAPKFNSVPLEFEKPILHFYGPAGLDVTVKVEIPQGHPLCYWPRPTILENQASPHQGRGGGRIVGDHRDFAQPVATTGLQWTGKLAQQPSKKMQPVPAGHWWNLAREINSSYLDTEQACERFIFYEALSRYQPTIDTIVAEDQLSISNRGQHDSGPILILVGDTNTRFVHVIDNLSPGSTARVKRAEMLARAQPPAEALKQFAHVFRQGGMTQVESENIAQIWQSDLTERLGFMVIHQIPTSVYDSLFPLTVTPTPDELVRVCLVIDTLFAQEDRRERLGWLPGVTAEVEKMTEGLSDSRFEVREAATRRLLQVGDLIEPQLNLLAQSKDPEVAGRAHMLLETLHRLPSFPKQVAQPVMIDVFPSSAIEGDR